MSFHVGQKIVCIENFDNDPGAWKAVRLPRKGSIYHVRELLGEYLALVEIRNPDFGNGDAFFASESFRPVIERKTDISTFTKLLTPQKELERT